MRAVNRVAQCTRRVLQYGYTHIRHHARWTEFTQVCDFFFVSFLSSGGYYYFFRSAKGFILPVINHSTATTTKILKPFSKLWANWLHLVYAFHSVRSKRSKRYVWCAAQFLRPHCQRRQAAFRHFSPLHTFHIPSTAYYLHYNPFFIFEFGGGDGCCCSGCCFRFEFFFLATASFVLAVHGISFLKDWISYMCKTCVQGNEN